MELPPYTRRYTFAAQTVASPSNPEPQPTAQHVFKTGDDLATLKIQSYAKSSSTMPVYYEGDKISGSFDIEVRRGDSIVGICAVVSGRIITGATTGDIQTFLHDKFPIWWKAVSKSKLAGLCHWDFEVPLPKKVQVVAGGKEYKLPETFLERSSDVSVQYELAIVIERGMFRVDGGIRTPFAYIPNITPAPYSLLRQLTNAQSLPVPSPEVDPQGWKCLEPVVGGYRLSIAKPLSYTRGSVIPVFLTLPCGVDLPTVLLQRSLTYRRAPSANVFQLHSNSDTVQVEYEDVGTAVWGGYDNTTSRSTMNIQGEIRLAKDLKPSSHLGDAFGISYSIILLPSTNAETKPLIEEPVEIATVHAPGARSESPPAYQPSSWSQTSTRRKSDYRVSVQQAMLFKTMM